MTVLESIDDLIEYTTEKSIEKKMLKQGKKYRVNLPPGKGKPLYTKSLQDAKKMAQEYGEGSTIEDLFTHSTWNWKGK